MRETEKLSAKRPFLFGGSETSAGDGFRASLSPTSASHEANPLNIGSKKHVYDSDVAIADPFPSHPTEEKGNEPEMRNPAKHRRTSASEVALPAIPEAAPQFPAQTPMASLPTSITDKQPTMPNHSGRSVKIGELSEMALPRIMSDAGWSEMGREGLPLTTDAGWESTWTTPHFTDLAAAERSAGDEECRPTFLTPDISTFDEMLEGARQAKVVAELEAEDRFSHIGYASSSSAETTPSLVFSIDTSPDPLDPSTPRHPYKDL